MFNDNPADYPTIGAYLRAKRSAGNESPRERSERVKRQFANGIRKGARSVHGNPFELLGPDQSMEEWHGKALANGVPGVRNDGTDRDMNRYWQERFGFAPRSIETRALGEDTSSAAGAGQAIVPQAWSTSFIDLARANLVAGPAGVTTMPMTTEKFNLPVWAADVAPVYLAENASNSLDATPLFNTVQFNAAGAYQDVTLVSRQIVDDTNQQGGLAGLMREVIARKYARLIDQVMFYGTGASPGNPGIVNESGVLTSGAATPAGYGTNGGAPPTASSSVTPYQQLSIAVETLRNNNVEPSGLVWNPKSAGTYARSTSTLGNPAAVTPDLDNVEFLVSSALASNETQGTGTNLSSIYIADWSQCVIGIRTELDVQVLRERYADLGSYGLWSYFRMSVRVVRPTAFYRLTGLITT